MARSEYWDDEATIFRFFSNSSDPESGSGPVFYFRNGNRYIDDSENHVAVIGKTGKGKSQCGSLPFAREVFLKNESLIIIDPKEECYRKTACWIPEGYQVFCVDFRNPFRSPTRWNPLYYPYMMYCSDDPADQDTGSLMISELYSGIYPVGAHDDAFWPQSAAGYTKGLTYFLFDNGTEAQINLSSIAKMMEQSEERDGGVAQYKKMYDDMPSNCLAKRFFSVYATAPNETRGSIHSVADNGFEVFSRSKGLKAMLGKDTLFTELDMTRPFVIYIILPDETDIYHGLAGVLVSQLTRHLIRYAQDHGGVLDRRVNIILEELGSVGKSIPELPNLMTAGRSRNLRMMLILQDGSQLDDVYGPAKAKAINACIGITMGFSTNSWETLTEWSQRCGERRRGKNLNFTEPLISPVELAAMPTGTALVIADNRIKFITHMPLYDEMYDNSGWTLPEPHPVHRSDDVEIFDLTAFLREKRQAQVRRMMMAGTDQNEEDDDPMKWFRPAPETPQRTYTVCLKKPFVVTKELEELFARETGYAPFEARILLKNRPEPRIQCANRREASRIIRELGRLGVMTELDE